MDLHSHGVLEANQLGCPRANLGQLFYMQIRAAIIEIHIFFHTFATTHANVTQLVSKCMFTWSNSTLDALKIIISVDNDNKNHFNLNKFNFLFALNNSLIILQCSQNSQ